MDIRFLAVIFLIVALMEMLAKMARKRRGRRRDSRTGLSLQGRRIRWPECSRRCSV